MITLYIFKRLCVGRMNTVELLTGIYLHFLQRGWLILDVYSLTSKYISFPSGGRILAHRDTPEVIT